MFEGSPVFIHGLYFIPSDEELMREYLLKKFRGEEFHPNVIEEYNVYSTEPWNLPRNLMHSKDGKVYYFSEAKRSNLGSRRLSRLAGNGFVIVQSTELVLCSIQESGRGEETSSITKGNSNSHLLGCNEALVNSDMNVDHGQEERSLPNIVCIDGYHTTKTEPLRITRSNCNGEYGPEIALRALKRSRLEKEGFLLGGTSTEAVGINNNNFNGDFMISAEENVLLNGGQTTYHSSMCPPFLAQYMNSVGTHQVSCMESLEPNFIYAPFTDTTSTVTPTATREDEAHAIEMLQYSSQQQQQQQQQQFVGNEHVISMDMAINFTSRVGMNFNSLRRSAQTKRKI
ncbi:hypothetical protein J5N97_027580 [Dioscorea zingiberensis]|uniref:NAC domain-containing protein n=1 Tax=Dioscorea zingiberensis TaxID=325984 RepID=A0A9D5C4K6_9LILI|nr:hypothetical protein J5N97_027580 [Dioscorea zingiberensis]